MHLFQGGNKPQSIREFAEMFVESLLTFWVARFNLNPDILPSLTADVMIRLDEFLSHPNAQIASASGSPQEMAMKVEDRRLLDHALLDGTPVTSEKLAVVAVEAAERCAMMDWVAEELTRTLGENGSDLS